MNRKQRTIFLLIVFWPVVLGASGIWLWRADRQERLNRQLIAAIKREDTKAALAVLNQGADGNARDEPNVPKWKRIWDLVRGSRPATPTALLLSVRASEFSNGISIKKKEAPELVNALLAHGAHINEIDRDRRSPLFLALIACNKRTARLLIEHGANVGDPPTGESLLECAIVNCHDPALTELMLQHGAKINGGRPGWTPLVSALMENDVANFRVLLRYHADPNANLPDNGQENLLEYAEDNHQPEIAKLLRDADAKR